MDGVLSGLRQMLQEHMTGGTKRLRVQVSSWPPLDYHYIMMVGSPGWSQCSCHHDGGWLLTWSHVTPRNANAYYVTLHAGDLLLHPHIHGCLGTHNAMCLQHTSNQLEVGIVLCG